MDHRDVATTALVTGGKGQDRRTQHLVPVREDVGPNREGPVHDSLGRETSGVDLRRYPFDGDAGGGEGAGRI